MFSFLYPFSKETDFKPHKRIIIIIDNEKGNMPHLCSNIFKQRWLRGCLAEQVA